MKYPIERFVRTVKTFLREDQVITDRDGLSHYSYDATEIHFMPHVLGLEAVLPNGDIINVATFGHAGDGNLHITIQYRKRNFEETYQAYNVLEEVYKKTIAMSGKLTGEHGVGITAKNYMKLQMADPEIELMKRIKYAFDPKGLLNPEKVFPDE